MFKEIIDSKKIIIEIIIGFIVYLSLFSIAHWIFDNIVLININALIIKVIISSIIQIGLIFLAWRFSFKRVLKKNAIDINDIKKIKKFLIIFTFIICLIFSLLSYINIIESIEEQINSNIMGNYEKILLQKMYGAEYLNQYEKEKQAVVVEMKIHTMIYSFIYFVIFFIVSILSLLLNIKLVDSISKRRGVVL